MKSKDIALVRMANKTNTDLTGKEGYIAEYNGGLQVSGGTNALGVITEGGKEKSDIAVLGTYSGTVRAKASGTVTVGKKVIVDSAGKIKDLSGSGTVVGVALESGVADELVEIAPMQPVVVSAS